MPELPEVETVRRGLDRLLPHRKIQDVTADTPKSFPNAPADVRQFAIGAQVRGVKRRAKVLLIELSSNYTFVIHLKMTGQLVFVADSLGVDHELRFGAGHPNASLVGNLPDKSTRVIVTFSDQSHLYFNDQRKFGWFRLLPTPEVMNLDFFKKVGPEPLAATFRWQDFRGRLMRRSKSGIKSVLLDQTVVAGIGNIYADESLWGAKIHPSQAVQDVSVRRIHALYDALIAVLQLSIEKGGSTNQNYVNAEGKRGSYMDFANVFRREGLNCPRCATTIIKLRVAGRGTHICPKCQKLAD